MRSSHYGACALALCVIPVLAQPKFSEGKLHGRDAYILENGTMRVSALRGAGHIAEIRFATGTTARTVNPRRVPHYPTIDPMDYDNAKHDPIYGGGTNRRLMAGYMGHLLNFPQFGPPSEWEAQAGLPNHGGALMVAWEKTRGNVQPDAVTFG